jgi:hypothetical protein
MSLFTRTTGRSVFDPVGRRVVYEAEFVADHATGVTVKGEVTINADTGVVGFRNVSISAATPLQPADLRSISWSKLLDAVLDRNAFKADVTDAGLVMLPSEPVAGSSIRRSDRRGRRQLTDEFLGEVAEIYRANTARAPTHAVADWFQVARSTAGGYVQAARKRGLLGPAPSRGAKGEQA